MEIKLTRTYDLDQLFIMVKKKYKNNESYEEYYYVDDESSSRMVKFDENANIELIPEIKANDTFTVEETMEYNYNTIFDELTVYINDNNVDQQYGKLYDCTINDIISSDIQFDAIYYIDQKTLEHYKLY